MTVAVARETIEIQACADDVFDLVHDYTRRLEWDPFLRAAYLCDGAARAGVGVSAHCAARWQVGGLAMDTVYVSFKRPCLAAVRMTRGPAILSSFAATIRQEQIAEDTCRVTYISQIRVRPRALRAIIEPIVCWVFGRETRRRLKSLKSFVECSDTKVSA